MNTKNYQVDRIFSVHIFGEVELEVELPGGWSTLRQISLLVQEGKPQLNDLQQVDVASKELVLVIGRGFKLAFNQFINKSC